MEKKPYETPEIQVIELAEEPLLLMQSKKYGGSNNDEGWMN